MTSQRFVQGARLHHAITELDGRIPIFILRLDLNDLAGTDLHDSNGNCLAIREVDLGHTDFFAYDGIHSCLLQLDFNIDASRKLKLHESIDRFGCGFDDVDQPLMGTPFELLP